MNCLDCHGNLIDIKREIQQLPLKFCENCIKEYAICFCGSLCSVIIQGTIRQKKYEYLNCNDCDYIGVRCTSCLKLCDINISNEDTKNPFSLYWCCRNCGDYLFWKQLVETSLRKHKTSYQRLYGINEQVLCSLIFRYVTISTFKRIIREIKRGVSLNFDLMKVLLEENCSQFIGSDSIDYIFNTIKLPKSNILPEINHEISIEYKKKKFNIKYKIAENKNNSNLSNINSEIISMIAQEKPSIYLSTVNNSSTKVDDIYEILNDITYFYLEYQKQESGRFRYENSRSHWIQIQKLSSCRGLDSIALDYKQEKLLKKELDTFINDRTFYENLGLPYRRGILLYGKPGTGKTSLINAISSHLIRDIYYLNLKSVEDDSELSALFNSVPSNQLIVLEDVDAQTKIIHKRSNKPLKEKSTNDKSFDNKKDDKKKNDFSLSSLLSCLDGHILSEGNIIIMSTNHVEFLDPACIRPGRMDLHLELDYCTQYQIKKLVKSVISHSEISEVTLKKIPERLLPPCEVMTTLTLYREDKLDIIIHRILELVNKYKEKLEIESTEVIKRKNFKKRKFKEDINKSRNFKKIKISN